MPQPYSGNGASVYRWRVRRQHQADAVPVSCAEDAADPAGEGHHHRVHQERGLQVRAGAGRLLPAADRNLAGLLQVPGAAPQRLQVNQHKRIIIFKSDT